MNKVIIIAEAGVNHNGSIERAKELIRVAANAGVDYVKFQTFKAENLVSQNAKKADYQTKNTGNKESQFLMLKKLELAFEDFKELHAYSKQNKVGFLSTGFDFQSIDFLDELGMDFFKIPSGEITNLPYLEYIAKKNRKVILSTGMADMNEIKAAIGVLERNGLRKEDLTVLHCNTEYPTPMKDVNLKAMLHIQKEFGLAVGYSDHTLGIEVPIAAVALGAKVIEKHFTLAKTLPGPDHIASLEPEELKAMVEGIRNIELATSGNGLKTVSESEMKNRVVARKSIVASREIIKGEIFTSENITIKRPGKGMSPIFWDDVIGKRANKSYKLDEYIKI